MAEGTRRRYRSLFWPLVLIGVGLLWLLANLGIISGANVAVLFRLWPLFLIAIGLDLLFARQSPQIGALIGGGMVVVVFFLMLVGPGLGLAGDYEVQSESISEPLGDARTARVEVDLSAGDTTITALTDSNNLIEGDINYVGELDFRASGEESKTITLNTRTDAFDWPLDWFGFATGQELRWDIGLSPDVELDLDLNSGSGNSEIDLTGLQLTAFTFDGGSGDSTVSIPALEDRYTVRISVGSGRLNLNLAQGADVALDMRSGSGGFALNIAADVNADIELKTGSGNMTIDIAEGTALRLRAELGSGNLSVPNWLEHVSGDDNDGVWETENYGAADTRVAIEFEGGSGDLTIR